MHLLSATPGTISDGEEAIDLDPARPDGYLGRGEAYLQAGKPADQSSVHGPHWAQRPWASSPRLNAINLFIIRTFASNLNPPAALCV